jgi:hypothetical protein
MAPENVAQTGSTAESAGVGRGELKPRLYVETKEFTDLIMATGTSTSATNFLGWPMGG